VVVPSTEVAALRAKHLISSTAHRADGVHARVVGDCVSANSGRNVEPTLEDAYLSVLAAHRNGTAAGVVA
jgi:hypothetical protein